MIEGCEVGNVQLLNMHWEESIIVGLGRPKFFMFFTLIGEKTIIYLLKKYVYHALNMISLCTVFFYCSWHWFPIEYNLIYLALRLGRGGGGCSLKAFTNWWPFVITFSNDILTNENECTLSFSIQHSNIHIPVAPKLLLGPVVAGYMY